MKCQSLFSGEISEKKVIDLLSVELAKIVVKVIKGDLSKMI